MSKIFGFNIFVFRILTGSYDSTLHLWTSKGKHKQVFSGHVGPVKAVCWISDDETSALFARCTLIVNVEFR